MKFYVSTAFRELKEAVEIAKAADDLGYDGVGIPDHVVNLETLATPYPYTHDGKRRWEAFTDWPDPWVLVGAMAQVTTRLKFVTTVYIPAMRDPYAAAKAIGTPPNGLPRDTPGPPGSCFRSSPRRNSKISFDAATSRDPVNSAA